jgi:hypothetical protein
MLLSLTLRYLTDISLVKAIHEQWSIERPPEWADIFSASKTHGKTSLIFGALEWGVSLFAVIPMLLAGFWVLIFLFGETYMKVLKGNTRVLEELAWLDSGDLQNSMIVIVISIMISLTMAVCIWMSMVFVPYFVAIHDQREIPICLKASFRSCGINVWSLTALGFGWFALGIMGILFFGIGIFVAAPVIHISIYMAAKDIFELEHNQ